ncbi:hypothetical protein EDD22DRAFT_962336 [Suillus occidentalis]|nr:hypothetical protein EDD22DRAFT_962336 [Suillus occidentalis]
MPNATVHRAVIAKRADVESKRLRALATAWELESTEKHAMLLQLVLKDKAEEYVDSMAETTFFEKVLVKRGIQELKDNADFTVTAYTHDLAVHQIADEQLNHLEEIGIERGMHLPLNDPSDGALDDAEVRLDECLESILKEAENSKQISPVQQHVGSLHHRCLKPIMLVPCKQPSSRSKILSLNGTSSDATGPEHFQPSSEQRQFDADIDFDTASQLDALAREPSQHLRRIPRSFEDVLLSDVDAAHDLDDVDVPPAPNARLPKSRI